MAAVKIVLQRHLPRRIPAFDPHHLRIAAALALPVLLLAGCHRPRVHLAPSTALPGPVTNVAAIRGNDSVWLNWTMPRKTTDRHSIKSEIRAIVCRRDSGTSPCINAGEPLLLTPGADGSFNELLPADLVSGPVRPLHYFLKVENSDGRSTGLLTGVVTVAGAAPSPVRNLTVKLIQQTAQLCWAPAGTKAEEGDGVRIFRTILPKEGTQQGQSESDKPPQPSQSESFDVDSSLT